jgi:hypothetical protein
MRACCWRAPVRATHRTGRKTNARVAKDLRLGSKVFFGVTEALR